MLYPPQATTCRLLSTTESEWPNLPWEENKRMRGIPGAGKGGMLQLVGNVSMLVSVPTPPVIMRPACEILTTVFIELNITVFEY